MRIRSYGELGLLGAILFILGWLSGSSLAPPVATTAGRVVDQPRAVAPAPHVPRVAHLTARAPLDPPRTRRNPFMFGGAPERAAHEDVVPDEGRTVDTDAPGEAADAPAAPALPAVPWRMVGVASAPDGAWTAILAGGGDVALVRLADTLPGGWTVVAVDASGATLRGPDGVEHALALP